jgi:hypothetical protein
MGMVRDMDMDTDIRHGHTYSTPLPIKRHFW